MVAGPECMKKRFWIGWIALLPVGTFLLLAVHGLFFRSSEFDGFGWAHSSVYANPAAIDLGERGTFFSLTLQGKTPAKACWREPVNYTYESLDLEIRGKEEVNAVADLRNMILRLNNGEVPLTEEALSKLLFGDLPLEKESEEARAIHQIFGMILSAGDGTLPPPRHHLYPIEGDLFGNLSHFSLGARFSRWILWWLGIWTAIGIGTLASLRSQKA